MAPPDAPATVLYLHSSDDLYGADRVLLEIVTGVDRRQFTPIVVLPDDMRHVGLLSAELSSRGIEWMHLPIAIVRRRYFTLVGFTLLLGRLLRGTWALRRIARQRQVRLIHGFTLAVAAAPAAALLLRLPLIMHAHEILERPRTVRRLLHWMAVRWSSRVLCVSEATRQNVLKDQPAARDRIQVIPNGIRPPQPSRLTVPVMRDRLGVPRDSALVGMLGRVSAWKGQETFLESAALVSQRYRQCHFVAVGGVFDNERKHLERLEERRKELRMEDVFILRNFMKDARAMLPALDILVLPSTAPDPFPTVILEAMSAAVPVIAFAHGGPLEMVVDGVTGLLVAPGDAAALASAIEVLLDDPSRRREMGEAGRRRVVEHFEMAAFLAAIERAYASTIGEFRR